jgi:nucleotide-binding universal stress UspA family protein
MEPENGATMKILLAVDDDRPSYEAAVAVARWFPDDAKVVALYVGATVAADSALAWPDVAGSGLMGYPYVTASSLSGEPGLQHAREVAGRAAAIVDGSARVERGSAVDTICRVAQEIGADLIVVGTGDRGWLSRLLEPSVGAGVATRAPCSVLVVRSDREV